MDLKGKSFLKLLDFTPAEIDGLIDYALVLKDQKKKGIPHRLCAGKNIALVFEKTSTRTRCAFEVAAADLGMHPVYLDPSGSQIGKKESIADTARVLGRMFDGIEYRGFWAATIIDSAYSAAAGSITDPKKASRRSSLPLCFIICETLLLQFFLHHQFCSFHQCAQALFLASVQSSQFFIRKMQIVSAYNKHLEPLR